MQKYETIFVVDSLLKAEEIESIINKYERFISANGGQIETVDKWGKKRLAYEIKKRQYGYYVLIRFDGPGSMIKQLEREYRLNESILRYKTFVMDKKALKALEKSQSVIPTVEKTEDKDSVSSAEDKSTPSEPVETPSEKIDDSSDEEPVSTEEEQVKDSTEEEEEK